MPQVLAPGVVLLVVALALAPPLRAAEITCPASLRLDEHPAGAEAWIESPGERSVALSGASLINGVPGDERGPAPAVLAPDDERSDGARVTQDWDLEAYREGGLILVCRYEGTSATLTAVLGETMRRCTLSFNAVAEQDTTRYERFAVRCR